MLRQCWNCIGPYGRFIELGEKGIASNSRLEMANFSKGTLFASLDISDMWTARRSIVEKLWADAMNLLRAGAIHGPALLSVRDFSDVGSALTELENGSTNKVVVSAPPGTIFIR